MKFVLLEEGGEVTAYEVMDVPWEDMTPEQREQAFKALIRAPEETLQ